MICAEEGEEEEGEDRKKQALLFSFLKVSHFPCLCFLLVFFLKIKIKIFPCHNFDYQYFPNLISLLAMPAAAEGERSSRMLIQSEEG